MPPAETMRCFFSLPLSDGAFEAANAMLRELKERMSEIKGAERLRWLRPRDLHLTLEFLGELPPSELPELVEAGRAAAATTAPFSLDLKGYERLGPRHHAALTLAVAPSEAFNALTRRLQEELRDRGFPRGSRRPPKPHLTFARIARLPPPLDKRLRKAISEREPLPPLEVSSFELTKSQLHPGGASYSLLDEFLLGA